METSEAREILIPKRDGTPSCSRYESPIGHGKRCTTCTRPPMRRPTMPEATASAQVGVPMMLKEFYSSTWPLTKEDGTSDSRTRHRKMLHPARKDDGETHSPSILQSRNLFQRAQPWLSLNKEPLRWLSRYEARSGNSQKEVNNQRYGMAFPQSAKADPAGGRQ